MNSHFLFFKFCILFVDVTFLISEANAMWKKSKNYVDIESNRNILNNLPGVVTEVVGGTDCKECSRVVAVVVQDFEEGAHGVIERLVGPNSDEARD